MGGWDIAIAAEQMRARRQLAAERTDKRRSTKREEDGFCLTYTCENPRCGEQFSMAVDPANFSKKAHVPICPGCGSA